LVAGHVRCWLQGNLRPSEAVPSFTGAQKEIDPQ